MACDSGDIIEIQIKTMIRIMVSLHGNFNILVRNTVSVRLRVMKTDFEYDYDNGDHGEAYNVMMIVAMIAKPGDCH